MQYFCLLAGSCVFFPVFFSTFLLWLWKPFYFHILQHTSVGKQLQHDEDNEEGANNNTDNEIRSCTADRERDRPRRPFYFQDAELHFSPHIFFCSLPFLVCFLFCSSYTPVFSAIVVATVISVCLFASQLQPAAQCSQCNQSA